MRGPPAMDAWTTRYRESDIWTVLSEIGPLIDQGISREELDVAAREKLERLRGVLTFVGKRLNALDGQLVVPAPFDSLVTHFRGFLPVLRDFVANGELTLLDNANSSADAGLTYLGQLVIASGHDELQGQREAAQRFRDTMTKGIEEAASANETLRASISELERKVLAVPGLVESQRQAELSVVQTKVSELAAVIEAQRQSVAQVTSDFQGQFSADQQNRNTEHATAERAREERFNDIRERYSEALLKLKADADKEVERLGREQAEALRKAEEEHNQRAAGLVAEIDTHRVAVERLVGVIGARGVTYGYKKEADRAWWAALIWQVLTFGALVWLVILAYRLFATHVVPPPTGGTVTVFSWWEVVARLAVTITLGVLAGYAGSQAARYQEVERRNRRLALELEAIGPYVAPLPEDQQHTFRVRIGQRSFGRGDTSLSGKGPTNALSLLFENRQVRKFVMEALKTWQANQAK